MTFEELENLKPIEFQKLYEEWCGTKPPSEDTQHWADYTDFYNFYMQGFRAGQSEMRERASGVAREGQSLHIWAWIRDLPLEGDE